MRNFTIFTLFFLATFHFHEGNAQGCVAIRGASSCGVGLGEYYNSTLTKGEFIAGTGFRYFKSFRHFRGHEEEVNRVEDGTEVINHSYFLDLFLNYGISDRFYGNLVVPFVYHNRSSMYEHGGNPPRGLGERHETSSHGLSDIRLGVGYWLFNPKKVINYNYAIGLGVKLPTGKYDYTDLFYNQGPERNEDRIAVVDQSIQPGDGGTGITLDMQGYHVLSHSLTMSVNLFYLMNFQETNGILTRNGRSEFSCPDQYALRLGTFYNTKMEGLSAYLGGRLEGIPSSDLVGGSAGYRRPGYVLSVEPGITYAKQKFTVNLSVPLAVSRNRTQSYQDKELTESTGVYVHGDAAFADYLINFNFFFRFGGKHNMPNEKINHLKNLNDL
ncbi:transporter [Flexithrix dorotheae]|uniref:transporter n=1 Tax=Flexithrix dorotheae TaxID=70993 RepID=UPI0005C5CFC7|nr:transporter [Flexithrix dorotheae]